MRNRQIRLGVMAALALALVAGVAWWTGWMSSAQALFAQTVQQAGSHGDGHSDETDSHDDHEEEGHDDPPEDDHEEEGHDGHAEDDGDEEGGEPVIRLSPEQMSRFGVTLATAKSGTLHMQIRLPGEIVVNADRTAHVVPSAGGVVRKVALSVGDSVSAGQAMAVLESVELSEAKAQYLAKLNELSCCSADLTRAAALDASARELLKVLATSPTLNQLRALKLEAMADGHSKLIAAYAEFVFARAHYEREAKLVEQDVSSRSDFQTATNAYKKAFAELVAWKDGLAYQKRRALLEARRSRQNMELEVRAAVQKLYVLGVSSHEVPAQNGAPQAGGTVEPDCDDPNGTECLDHKATAPPAATEMASRPVLGEQLGVYSLRAPFAGTVIDKHITLGEILSNDTPVFTVADLSMVWVDLSVYQKDLPHVRKGQIVHIALGKEIPPVEGRIAFVSPIVDSETRTAKARIILANPRGVYRPGLFVTADIDVSAGSVPVLVPRTAVQRIEGQDVVFVPTEGGVAVQRVRLGQSSRTHVEIAEGLRAGRKYVVQGAFQLKAQVVTSGLGAHAGHGH